MADVSDPAIAEAYNDVRNDKTDTNWISLQYVDEKSNKICVAGSGTGGLSEFVSNLKDDTAAFGYLRINVANDNLSNRSKFLLVSWCGPEVKVMRKAKLSVHIADIKKVIQSFAVEIPAGEKTDLEQEKVLLLLKKAMGANYDRQGSSY